MALGSDQSAGSTKGRGFAVLGTWRRKVVRPLFRLAGQFYGAIGLTVTLTFIASLSAWLAFDNVGDAQKEVNENSVPQLAASFAVAQRSNALAAAAFRLTATTTREELAEVDARVVSQRQAFEIQLSALTSQSGERFDQVRRQGGALVTNIVDIERSAAQRFVLADRGAELRDRMQTLDDELGRLLGGFTIRVRDDVNTAMRLLANAFTVQDPASLEEIRKRYDGLTASIRRSAPVTFARLSDLGPGRDGIFAFRTDELRLLQRQEALLNANREFSGALLAEIEGLVSAAQGSAVAATGASEQAVTAGRRVLLAINGISIVGGGLIAWLVVGRMLLRRLQRLSDRMRAMADGDLEGKVDVPGRDEVADMAAALEVFRRHALEVQRLNLVEKLAEELQGKNEQLEATLDELHRVQSQIVAREKLAGLGELTAGVAHEISNPLNFVNNFSEASQELLVELGEELEDDDNQFNDAQKEILQELSDLLTTNLEHIRSHGGRAARIVGDMQKMGGSSGERQLTDVNNLLRDQVGVAIRRFESERQDLEMQIKWELDSEAGRVEVVPRDVGRVFQNLVANACDATEERLRANEEQGNQYEPTLLFVTKRFDDHVEVRIRDNGMGIPADVVDKIFNPFFTTKPTDQGTGLGLSLCNDILRGHGGTVRVETEVGDHTEMIVELPTSSTLAEELASESE